MKKFILLAIIIFFGLSHISFAASKSPDPNKARIKDLQTVLIYLTKQRATYLDNAKQTLRTFDAQIQDAQEQIRALQPKVDKNEKKEKVKIGP